MPEFFSKIDSAIGIKMCDGPNLTGKCTFEHNTDKGSRMNKCLSITDKNGKTLPWSFQMYAGTICVFSRSSQCPVPLATGPQDPTHVIADLSTDGNTAGMQSAFCYAGTQWPDGAT
jgi:hypothetical protein